MFENNLQSPFGYILCGGASKRMGASKPLQLFQGRALIEHMTSKLQQLNLIPILVQKTAHAFESPHQSIFDNHEDYHPLFGIATALTHASKNQDTALIIPCDSPLLLTNDLQKLLSDHPSVAYDTEGFVHATIGHYPCTWKDWILSLAQKHQPTKELAKVSKRVTISIATLKNCNHPQDLQ